LDTDSVRELLLLVVILKSTGLPSTLKTTMPVIGVDETTLKFPLLIEGESLISL
jgi:hypothetical protein